MSLINQMLKDLDARHEADARGRLHREVRPLPAAESARGRRLAGLLALVAVLLAAAWWASSQSFVVAPRMPTPVVTPAPEPVAPATVAAPAAAVPAAALSTSAGEPAAAAVPVAAPEGPLVLNETSGMKMSAMLDRVPETAPADVRPAKAAPRREALPVPAPAATGGKPPKAEAAPLVEKQPVTARGARDQSEADYRRAMTLVNGARVSEATDVLLDVLRRDGGHTASRQLLARLLIEQRRLDEAYAILAEGLALQPGQIGWAMTLARLQVERGDLAGAARTLQGSQSFATGNADYLGFSGHVQQRLGQPKAAVEFYQAAVRLAPNEGRWWLGLGLALESDQRTAESREAFLRARSSGSVNPDLQGLVDQKLR